MASQNWASGAFGSRNIPVPKIETAFERKLQKLELNHVTMYSSEQLRQWCKAHRNSCYIPEELLRFFGIPTSEWMEIF